MQRTRKCSIWLFIILLLCSMYVLVTRVLPAVVASRQIVLPNQLSLSVVTEEVTEESAKEVAKEELRSHGYVLVKRYSGQQGAGIKAVCSLQKWIKDLNLPMKIVEPFLIRSVVGVHSLNRGEKDGVRFSDMFDIDSFNAASREEGLPEMTPWSDYYNDAPKNAVYIEMTAMERNGSFTSPTVTEKAQNNCTMSVRAPDNTIISYCQLRSIKFYWKFANTHTLSNDDVYGSIMKGLDLTNITLIFSLWRGPWTVDEPGTHSQSPAVCLDNDKFKDSPKLHHSMEVYQNKYLNSHGSDVNRYVAVMIRAEHSVLQFKSLRSTNIPKDIIKCLEQLYIKTGEAMKEIGTDGLLVTSDVGYYGSSSWGQTVPSVNNKNEIMHMVEKSVERLYKGRTEWTFEDWEQSFIEASDGIVDKGYIAALQRVLASSNSAGCLILMGGGLFQELSLENYLQHTKEHKKSRCIHMICVQRTYHQSFTAMITKAEE